jgi:hypothetical protein
LPPKRAPTSALDRGLGIGIVSRVFCGFCKPEPRGVSCRKSTFAVHCWRGPAMGGRTRGLTGGVARAAERTGRQRFAVMGGDLPRWQLRPSEKGSAAVGKARRGKGTTWMVLVDGQGRPLGVRLESASPLELRLRKPRWPKSAWSGFLPGLDNVVGCWFVMNTYALIRALP